MTTNLWKRLEALEAPAEAQTFIRWRMPDGALMFRAMLGSPRFVDVTPAGARVIEWPVPLPRFEVCDASA